MFALYAKNLVEGGSDSQVPALLSGVVGLIGVLGLLVAWKDRVPPIRLLLGSMVLLGVGTIIGGIVSVPAFAAMLFLGFLSFFVGKIAADTIVQQAILTTSGDGPSRSSTSRTTSGSSSRPDPVLRLDRGRPGADPDDPARVGRRVPGAHAAAAWARGCATGSLLRTT